MVKIEKLGIKISRHGNVYLLHRLEGAKVLLIATDNIVYNGQKIAECPKKGAALTELSKFWRIHTENIIRNNSVSPNRKAEVLSEDLLPFENRLLVAHRTTDLGLTFKYEDTGRNIVSKVLVKKDNFSVSLSHQQVVKYFEEWLLRHKKSSWSPRELTTHLQTKSDELFWSARQYLSQKKLVLLSTRFRFGFCNQELMLHSEFLTPHSAIICDEDSYGYGKSPKPYAEWEIFKTINNQKQQGTFFRFNISEDVIRRTSERYVKLCKIVTGRDI